MIMVTMKLVVIVVLLPGIVDGYGRNNVVHDDEDYGDGDEDDGDDDTNGGDNCDDDI